MVDRYEGNNRITDNKEDKDNSEEISLNLKFQEHEAVDKMIFSQRAQKISDYEEDKRRRRNNMKIYVGEVSESIFIEMRHGEENDMIAYSLLIKSKQQTLNYMHQF